MCPMFYLLQDGCTPKSSALNLSFPKRAPSGPFYAKTYRTGQKAAVQATCHAEAVIHHVRVTTITSTITVIATTISSTSSIVVLGVMLFILL